MASGSKILAVVHDDLLRELLRDFLSERFQVSVAGDVLEGTDLLLADGYDLLLVQDNMPVMTGREYIAVLDTCEEFSTPPLVLISADRNLEAQMHRRPDRGFLPMPFGLDELGSLVRQLSPPPVPLLGREKVPSSTQEPVANACTSIERGLKQRSSQVPVSGAPATFRK